MDKTGDPWNGRTLEWATSSPPPFYNFAVIPKVVSHEPFWEMKQSGYKSEQSYEDILMPKNTGMGIYISLCAFIAGFAIVWSIHWLTILGLLGVVVCLILLSLEKETEYVLTAIEIEQIERSRG